MIVHFGETLPESITPEHIISSALLFVWALSIFIGMLFCFGIGAATGDHSSAFLIIITAMLIVLQDHSYIDDLSVAHHQCHVGHASGSQLLLMTSQLLIVSVVSTVLRHHTDDLLMAA